MRQQFIIALLIIVASCGSSFACSIKEIVVMSKDGAGKKAIRMACDEDDEVDDAPKCDLSKVIAYSKAGLSEHDIKIRCELCENPSCSTGIGDCPMISGEVRKHGYCTCVNPTSGVWVSGSITCNN